MSIYRWMDKEVMVHIDSGIFSSVQFSSVTQSCPILCNPTDYSMPGLPVHHQLPEFTQTHVHWVGDAIQLSHPLLSTSPPTFNLSQHQGLSNDSVLHIRWPVLPVVRIPEREERRLPKQCNSQKGSLLLTRVRFLPHPTQWCRVREPQAQAVTQIYRVCISSW